MPPSGHGCQDDKVAPSLTACSECPVNLEVLNKYALGALGLFAVSLCLAMGPAGFIELLSRLPKAGVRKGRLRKQRTTRKMADREAFATL